MGDKETAQRISAEIKALSARYIADNSWFRFYSGTGLDPMAPESYADAAGRAYVHVQKAVVPLLLGDTKLRSDQELVSNFGLSDGESAAAAAGPARAGAPVIPIAGASMASASASARPPGSPGGILSNAKWSPMLNDAFILGGINGNKQFVFAPVGDDLTFFRSIAPAAAAGPGATKEQQIQAGASVWKQLFLAKPYLLWDRGFPRVFARELLGLAKFGYKPAPTAVNFSFDCAAPGAPPPNNTFADYLADLTLHEFEKPSARKVLGTIAQYLFGDERALDPIIH
jgi:hypothetical protein